MSEGGSGRGVLRGPSGQLQLSLKLSLTTCYYKHNITINLLLANYYYYYLLGECPEWSQRPVAITIKTSTNNLQVLSYY